MIKVIRIISRLNVGGPARHVLLLSEELKAYGFETVIFTGHLDEGEVHLEHDPRLRIAQIPGLGRQIAPTHDLRALWELVAAIRRERPTIVHTHTAKAGALGRVAALLAGVPIVVHTFHGHVLTHYFSTPGSLLVRWAERALSRITARVVTLSPRLRQELTERFHVASPERISVVPLGHRLAPFREATGGKLRRELGLPQEAFLVGGVGRMVAIKRFDLLVRSFARLAARVPQAHLVLVGDGVERKNVETTVQEEGLQDRVHLLGWREDLPAIYADLDLVALSSRNEGTPLAIVEAFAAGLPVVATHVGGIPDMFSHAPRNGLTPPARVALHQEGALVPPEDEEALAEAMQLFYEQSSLRARTSQQALSASRAYDAQRLAQDMATLYRQLLREHGLEAAEPHVTPS